MPGGAVRAVDEVFWKIRGLFRLAGLNKYPELKAKLENEYTPLENGELYGYSPSWDVFTLNPVPTGDAGDDYIHILVRKP